MASYPKSGNTFLRIFLNAYKTGGTDINNTGPFGYDDMGKKLYAKLCGTEPDEMTVHEVRAARGAYLQNICRSVGEGARVFMKTHSACVAIDQWPQIPVMFTEGAFYIVRDPRDVAVSYAHYCNQDPAETVDFMCKEGAVINHGPRTHVLGTWSEHVRSWGIQQGIKVYRLRYEDMVQQPKRTFGRVVEALGWERDEVRLDFAINATRFDKIKQQENEGGFAERGKPEIPFFRRGQVGAWRDELSPELARRIEQEHGPMMKELGYGCDGNDC